MEESSNYLFERIEPLIDERFQEVLYNGGFDDDVDPYDYITTVWEEKSR